MKASRILDMEKYITGQGSASMEELCQTFNVSINTVRRDVVELIRRGTVEKVYGGVTARKSDQQLTPYEERRISREAVKAAIGRKAAELVQDGDIIFIDSGTTTLQMIDCLAQKRDLTVITNNMEAVIRALPYENMTVIVLPGQLSRKTNSLTGDDTVSSLRRYNIRAAFMAATGLSAHGATNSSPREYEIKRAAIANSEKVYLLVNQEKIGLTGLMTFAPVSVFDAVVTDARPGSEAAELLQKENVELIHSGS
ncbi:MAG: DeoR/GlpR transcriptional regulator [Clostridia bacterium]|nr:DeoR/GlpR transcriptional regulator [Clostridia bacterium]